MSTTDKSILKGFYHTSIHKWYKYPQWLQEHVFRKGFFIMKIKLILLCKQNMTAIIKPLYESIYDWFDGSL